MRSSIQAVLFATAVLSTSMVYAASPTCPSAEMKTKGDITKAEHQKMTDARFDHMDANKDGVLTADERRAARDYMRANCPRGGKGKPASATAVK
ncbi:MAG: hypothetical protein ACRC01_12905 [Deefgea sp.]